MPKLIKLHGHDLAWVDDIFTDVADEDDMPEGPVILSLARFQAEGDALIGANRPVGVRVQADEEFEALAYDLPRIAVVALVFPKFRDGRHYSAARLLRERYGYRGELRAVGEFTRDHLHFMERVGFDAFELRPGEDAEEALAAFERFSSAYQK